MICAPPLNPPPAAPRPHSFYAWHSPFTDPGNHAWMYTGLPLDLPGLCRTVQGVLIHELHTHRYGVVLPRWRRHEITIRPVAGRLDVIGRLDPRLLAAARPPSRRMLATCRDYAVHLCSLLRHRGVPARVRCGFAAYFPSAPYEDHWICECWDANRSRWIRMDAQLDQVQIAQMRIEVDPLDLRPDEFIDADEVLRRCRQRRIDADRLFHEGPLTGLRFVEACVKRDRLALDKIELLPWDRV